MTGKVQPINAILLIYNHPIEVNAATIMEHIHGFQRHSEYKVFLINSLMGFPPFLWQYEFSVIVLHYSLFSLPIAMCQNFINYLKRSRCSYKIVFFQDEHRYWPERSAFLNHCDINCVYTLLDERWFEDTYRKKTNVKHLIHNIPGYVTTEIEEMARKYYKPQSQRTVDIGYRGRRLPYYMGRESQEKHIIGLEFKKKAKGLGLTLDIETDEKKRIYGRNWPLFLANCKSVLGVEAGVSVFDIDDEVRPRYAKIVTGHPDVSFPDLTFEEVYENLLKPYENRIYYRTISPRHFEAAALRICQILFEGKYSGIMEPMKHYIPLKKDFSNFDTVVKLFKNEKVRKEITENAYNDLIASKKYTYKRFIEEFDKHLNGQGKEPYVSPELIKIVIDRMKRDRYRAFLLRQWIRIRYVQFPGRKFIRPIFKPIFAKLGI